MAATVKIEQVLCGSCLEQFVKASKVTFLCRKGSSRIFNLCVVEDFKLIEAS